MRSPLITERPEPGLVWLTLNRPERRNALNAALLEGLRGTLRGLAEDRAARVVVLTGAGSAFCAGADLQDMRARDPSDPYSNREDALRWVGLMEALSALPQALVARVNGAAVGGGVGLVAGCDLAVASSGARFRFPEACLGLAPAVISPYVVAAIGARQAGRYFLTGEVLDAGRARAIGLVHEVAEAARLDALVAELTGHLLEAGPGAVAACKQLLARIGSGTNEGLAAYTADTIARLRGGAEARAGIEAHLAGRRPPWARGG